MDIIDSKYIGLVSSRLQKFKRVKANLYNFRCPICGDSRSIRIKQEDISIKSKQIQTLSVITVVRVYHLIIF